MLFLRWKLKLVRWSPTGKHGTEASLLGPTVGTGSWSEPGCGKLSNAKLRLPSRFRRLVLNDILLLDVLLLPLLQVSKCGGGPAAVDTACGVAGAAGCCKELLGRQGPEQDTGGLSPNCGAAPCWITSGSGALMLRLIEASSCCCCCCCSLVLDPSSEAAAC
jgi:hypothetical protein